MSAVLVRGQARESRWALWSGVAGIAFAVLFTIGLFSAAGGTPDYDASEQEWIDWFADSGNRTGQVIGLFALVLAALAFLVFLVGLFRRLRAVDVDQPGWPTLALVAGGVFSGLTIVAAAAIAAVSAAIEFAPSDFPIPGADVAQVIEQFGFGMLLLGGGWTAAVFVAAASLALRGSDAVPAWLATAGLVVAVLLVASVTFLPLLLLPLWVLVVGIVMIRNPLVEVRVETEVATLAS